MRIHVIGGGPGGLYFAILAKKSDPSREVVVVERNAPDDTFGWGVVFSEATLENLLEADAETFAEIGKTFATWDHVDIHYQGEVVRTGGHGFCGIERKRLLNILQKRAEGLGVELRYRTEIKDPAAWLDCDLLGAAGGVHRVPPEH